tara:strand:+ start:110 stop:547 length:438 start_codon:yes stop_codon:yes gene_type:complete
MTEIYLDHFIKAHRAQFDSALTELLVGRKTTHWIWFIFPIAVGFGKSEIAQYYGITSMEEARAFIKDPYLGRNYITCIEAVMQHRTDDIEIILGSRIDKWKFRASLTLFEKAVSSDADRETILQCLECFYNGKRCGKTSGFISSL